MTSSHLFQPRPSHIKPKFRNFDTSSSNLTERLPPPSANNADKDGDSTPSSFRSEINPPEASTTPFEEIFNPRLKRGSTSNYESELAAHRKGSNLSGAPSDDEVATLTRRKSEKSTFEKMSPQIYKRQLSIVQSTDELAKKDQELDKMYSTNPRIILNGLDQSLPSSQQQHQPAATLSSSPERKNTLSDLRDKLQHKLHLDHDHHHHHHHNHKSNGQEDIPNFSKYEFGLNKSDSVSTLGFSSDGNNLTEDDSRAVALPQGRRESFNFNEYKSTMFRKSLSGPSGVPGGESNTHQ